MDVQSLASTRDHAMFTQGACPLLAKAIHDITGWPICAFWDGKDYNSHAFVLTPWGTYLDIEGEHEDSAEFRNRWWCDEIRAVPDFSYLAYWEIWEFDPLAAEDRAIEIAPSLVEEVKLCHNRL